VAGACATDDDSELAPLPIEAGTVARTTTTSSVPAPAPTTPGGLPMPAGGSSTSTTSTAVATPTGDWDGAAFDVGVIESVSTLGAYSTIELDRWSYTDPAGRTADATGLTEEPVVAWWRTSPFSNLRVQTRTFVLAPDVEVLTLDPAGRGAACAEPPPASRPAPEWLSSGTSALGSMAPGDVAVLTYSATGLVTRLRLTRGC